MAKKLTRITAANPIVTASGKPDRSFITSFNDALDKIDGGIDTNALDARIDAVDATATDALNLANYVAESLEGSFDTSPPDAVTGLIVTSSLEGQEDGSYRVKVELFWNTSVDADFRNYRVSAKETASANWIEFEAGTQTYYRMYDLRPNTSYDFKVAAVDAVGNRGAFSVTVTHVTMRDNVPPAPPTGLSAAASFQNIYLSWHNPADVDLNHVEVWENNVNDNTTAVRIATVNGQPSKDGAFTRAGLTTNIQRYYWLKAVDYSDNVSIFSDGIAATTAFVPALNISGTLADAQIAGLAASKVTGQLTDAQIASIATAKLTGQITATQITDGAISTPKLAAGSVTAAVIAADTITASQIAAGAITATELAAGSVVAGKIAAGSIQALDIAAGTITGDKIQANTIVGNLIAANTIVGNNIAAGTLTADKILAGSITGDRINTGTSLPGTITVGTSGVSIETVRGASTAGRGGNLLFNTDFSQNYDGWTIDGSVTSFGRDPYGLAWTPTGEHALGLSRNDTANLEGRWVSSWVTCAAFQWMEVQLMAAAHRCQVSLRVEYANASFVSTGAYETALTTVQQGGNLLSAWDQMYLKTQAPAGTAVVRLIYRKWATNSGPDSYAWFCRPFIGIATPEQSSPSPFSHSQVRTTTDPASVINSYSTQIDPGKILISGGTSLASWRNGTDATKIEGGSIQANTVAANKLTIGNRAVTFQDLNFQCNSGANTISWTSGYVTWMQDNGVVTATFIAGGSATFTGNYLHIYWIKGAGALSVTTNNGIVGDPNVIVVAVYQGGPVMIVHYGATIIDGARITTGTVTATQINVAQLSALTADVGLLRTSGSGGRMEIQANQLRVYDSSNVMRVRLGLW